RFPQSDGIVPPATGQDLPMRAPGHSLHGQAMSAQYPGRPIGHIPDGHERIRAYTGYLCAIRTPGHVVEAILVTLHNTHDLPMCYVPYPHGAIHTATEQAMAV